jgi:uncharacterized membrane protein
MNEVPGCRGAFTLTPRPPNLSFVSFVKAQVTRVSELPRRVFLLVMLGGAALITRTSLEYFDFEAMPPFALEKMPLRFEAFWFASLRVHVASVLLAFPLCLLLMTRGLQRRPALHRLLGRMAGILVLVGIVPSGAVLAFEAKGGAVVTAGFLLSGAIVGWFMVQGVLAARRRELVSHRRAMQHVVGQMSVAVTSRALMIAFDMAGMIPERAYVIALWLPVVASFVVVELLSRRSVVSLRLPLRSSERMRREVSLLAVFVPRRPVAASVRRFGR